MAFLNLYCISHITHEVYAKKNVQNSLYRCRQIELNYQHQLSGIFSAQMLFHGPYPMIPLKIIHRETRQLIISLHLSLHETNQCTKRTVYICTPLVNATLSSQPHLSCNFFFFCDRSFLVNSNIYIRASQKYTKLNRKGLGNVACMMMSR